MKTITEEEMWAKAREVWPLRDSASFDDNATNGARQVMWVTAAKWACDQQPKFKTLEDWGWIKDKWCHVGFEDFFKCSYKIDNGIVYIRPDWRGEQWFEVGPCDSIDHGKQLAENHYQKRFKTIGEIKNNEDQGFK